jgi:hypothetical protein
MLGPAALLLSLLFFASCSLHQVAATTGNALVFRPGVSFPLSQLTRVQQHRLFRASSSTLILPERPFRYPLPVQSYLLFGSFGDSNPDGSEQCSTLATNLGAWGGHRVRGYFSMCNPSN